MKANGFTLLEMLVALAVFGFLLVGLSQTVRFGLTAWHQDARLSDGKADLDAVDRSLRAIVENLASNGDEGQPSVDGLGDRLSGITRLRVPGSGLATIPVEAGLAVSGSRLVLRWRPYHHGIALGPAQAPAEAELIGGIAGVAIEYWRSPGVWVSHWQEPDLPMLIRFRIVFAGPNPRHWPDIVAAPLLSRP